MPMCGVNNQVIRRDLFSVCLPARLRDICMLCVLLLLPPGTAPAPAVHMHSLCLLHDVLLLPGTLYAYLMCACAYMYHIHVTVHGIHHVSCVMHISYEPEALDDRNALDLRQ